MAWQKLADLEELPKGGLIEVVRGERLYALSNVDGEVRAMSGLCPHHGGPLGQGGLVGSIVSCPWHAWPFDTKTGTCVFSDQWRVPTYRVRVAGSDILVDIPDA